MRSISLKRVVWAYCLFLSLSFLPGTLAAQNNASEAPVVWERYRVSGSDISITLPKLPTRIDSNEPCEEAATSSYYAYADGAIYEIDVTSKSKVPIPEWCEEKRRFGSIILNQRLARLRMETPKGSETNVVAIGGKDVTKFVHPGSSRWIVADIKNSRWVELAISRRIDSKVDEEKFIGSLKLGSKVGKEIGEGSSVTLGDAGIKGGVNVNVPVKAIGVLGPGVGSGIGTGRSGGSDPKVDVAPKGQEEKVDIEQLNIIVKPRASYTEDGKTGDVQGTVRLKVTFLANGGIGSVAPISGLPSGLTEQAIIAAKKMAFLPKRVNKIPVSVSRVVEYSFTIY